MVSRRTKIQLYALILVATSSLALPQQGHAALFQEFLSVGRIAFDVVRRTARAYTAPVRRAGKTAIGVTNFVRRTVDTPKRAAKKSRARFQKRVLDQAKATKKAMKQQADLVRQNSETNTVEKEYEKLNRKTQKQYRKSLARSEKIAKAAEKHNDKIVSREPEYRTTKAMRSGPAFPRNFNAEAARAAERHQVAQQRDYASYQRSIAREQRKRERTVRKYEKTSQLRAGTMP